MSDTEVRLLLLEIVKDSPRPVKAQEVIKQAQAKGEFSIIEARRALVQLVDRHQVVVGSDFGVALSQ